MLGDILITVIICFTAMVVTTMIGDIFKKKWEKR